jgi:hypothetical protein
VQLNPKRLAVCTRPNCLRYRQRSEPVANSQRPIGFGNQASRTPDSLQTNNYRESRTSVSVAGIVSHALVSASANGGIDNGPQLAVRDSLLRLQLAELKPISTPAIQNKAS